MTLELPRRRFQPTQTYTPVEGLHEKVMQLHQETRYRSALQPLLDILSSDPDNEHAFRLAAIVLGGGQTANRDAKEPYTATQWNDVRLDPIFAECSKCQAAWWVSHAYLHDAYAKGVSISNPVGMQCHRCRYVLCRQCFREYERHVGRGTSILELRCVSCGEEMMSPVVYPTGRRTREIRAPLTTITNVFVFRRGPVPPDTAYLQELLENVCSQAIEDRAHIRAIPMFPWPSHIETAAVYHVLAARGRGEVDADALSRMRTHHFKDQDQNPGYLIALTAPMLKPEEYQPIIDLLAQKRFREAVPLLVNLTKALPRLAVAWNDLGYAQICTGELAAAFESLGRALSLEVTPPTLNNLGLAHRIAGNSDAAIDFCEKALAMKRAFPEAAENLAEGQQVRRNREQRRVQWGLAAAPARAHEWPCYRGNPARSAEAEDGPIPPLAFHWQVQTNAIIDGSPAAALNRVFFGTAKGTVHCVDAYSGREYWQHEIESGCEIISSPAVLDDWVYIGAGNGSMVSLDGRTGKEVWRFQTSDEIKSSPVIAANNLLFTSLDGNLYCLDARGRENWRFNAGRMLRSSPAVFGEHVYLSSPGSLICLSLEKGREIWRRPRGFDQGNILAVTPAVTKAGVFVAGAEAKGADALEGHVYCFDPDSGEERWKWRWPTLEAGFQSSPAVAGNDVIIGGMDGIVVALNEDGLKWLNDDLLQWWILASPTVANGFIYLPVNDGNLHCLSASDGRIAWSTRIDSESEGASSSPTLANHLLYVGSSRQGLLCLGELYRDSNSSRVPQARVSEIEKGSECPLRSSRAYGWWSRWSARRAR